MPEITDVIDAIYPSDEQKGVPVGAQIFVLFDREIDETTIEDGGIFVVGPDTDTYSGPDLAILERPAGHALQGAEGDILQSPNYQGFVQGSWEFQRIDLTTTSGVNTQDLTGDGDLYRTKAIFTPDYILTTDTTYTVYVVGDEDANDSINTGVRPRSVFDVDHIGSGSDDLNIFGTYNGNLSTDVFNIEITTSGVKRTATFQWYKTSSPSDVHGPILTDKKVFLSDGVFVEFGTGIFGEGDEFTAVVIKQVPFENSFTFNFDTGSGSLVDVPDDISTSAIGNLVPQTVVLSTQEFDLSSITPSDRATNQPLTTKEIVLKFSSNIDPTTVTSERVKIIGSPVNGDEDSLFKSREIFKNLTVSGQYITAEIA